MNERPDKGQTTTLLVTKVRVPRRRPDILRRQRLIDALHQNLHRKLIFITAPAGYGKTTLLVDFAAEVPAQVCWYHITPGDEELTRFARYLAFAFLQRHPNLNETLGSWLHGPLPTRNPVALAGALVNALAELDDFTLLVLDDYHLVGERLPIVDFIEAFLEHLPDQVRLIIASRSVYGIPAARLFMRDELGVLGPQALRFTAQELQELAQQAYGVTLPVEHAEELARRTDGWVIAMLLALRLRTEGTLPILRGAQEHLYAFLAEEVLHHLPERLQRFLRESSMFEEFDARLCQEVLDYADAEDILAELENRNLFVTRVETPQGPVFRYHQLFADFLRNRLAQEAPDRQRALHLRAATWYWEHLRYEEAIAHRLAAGDREGAIPWMEHAARYIYTTGRYEVLQAWIHSLTGPPDLRPQAPQVLLYQAKVLGNANRFDESNALLELAYPTLRQRGDTALLAKLLLTKGFNARLQRQYEEALRLAQEVQDLLQPATSPQARLDLLQAQRLGANALFHLGKPQKAIASLKLTANALENLGQTHPNLLSETLYNLALVLQDLGSMHFAVGRLADALQYFQCALNLWREYHFNPVELPLLLNNLGFLYRRMGEYERALDVYRQAQNLARKHRTRALPLMMCSISEIYLAQGRFTQAHQMLQQALELGEQWQVLDAIESAHLGLAKLAALEGDFAHTFQHLHAATLAHNRAQDSLWYRWYQGYLLWLLHQPQQALSVLEEIADEIVHLSRENQIRYHLILTDLLRKSRPTEATQHLQRVLDVLSRQGYVHFLHLESLRLAPTLQAFQRKHPHPVLAALLELAQTPTTPPEPALPSVSAAVELEVHGFGTGEVFKNGERIPNAAWRAAGARALFFFILDRGPVRKEDLALAFWPDFSPAQVNSNLHTTLWRVRRALGDKSLIQVHQGRYRLHPEVVVHYDVHAFEHLLEQARKAPAEEDRLQLLRQAIDLYREDFLIDLDFPWISERRYELQRRCLEALDALIKGYRAQGEIPKLREVLEKALRLDPYNDLWHLYWMETLARSGAVAAARAHYQAYRERLRRELAADPDERLRAFYESL